MNPENCSGNRITSASSGIRSVAGGPFSEPTCLLADDFFARLFRKDLKRVQSFDY